ncbi:MAG: hypothetical protein HRU07_05785 [Nitrosopumilus sp.]|nr:hypothetical protein [Nitrosopumilus sp.]NRA05657.1 hypothetical protein [Nitrosopumilus sp.]
MMHPQKYSSREEKKFADSILYIIKTPSKMVTPKQYSITDFFGKEIKISVKTDKDGKMNFESC